MISLEGPHEPWRARAIEHADCAAYPRRQVLDAEVTVTSTRNFVQERWDNLNAHVQQAEPRQLTELAGFLVSKVHPPKIQSGC